MLELKQLEIQSLEKQIAILQDVSSTTPLQRRDSIQDTQLTIKSLQEEINRLQGQLAVSVLLQGFSVFLIWVLRPLYNWNYKDFAKMSKWESLPIYKLLN